MKRTKNSPSADPHFEAIGELVAQLRKHLTASAEKKGTYGDYLRLLEFYRDSSSAQVTQIIAGWVDAENHESDSPS